MITIYTDDESPDVTSWELLHVQERAARTRRNSRSRISWVEDPHQKDVLDREGGLPPQCLRSPLMFYAMFLRGMYCFWLHLRADVSTDTTNSMNFTVIQVGCFERESQHTH